jgi:hypothetical protein
MKKLPALIAIGMHASKIVRRRRATRTLVVVVVAEKMV